MQNTRAPRQRSFKDRRSTIERRDRWWRMFMKRPEIVDDKRDDAERRTIPEKRSEWERISTWSSAPKLRSYRFPYLRAISRFNDFPFW